MPREQSRILEVGCDGSHSLNPESDLSCVCVCVLDSSKFTYTYPSKPSRSQWSYTARYRVLLLLMKCYCDCYRFLPLQTGTNSFTVFLLSVASPVYSTSSFLITILSFFLLVRLSIPAFLATYRSYSPKELRSSAPWNSRKCLF